MSQSSNRNKRIRSAASSAPGLRRQRATRVAGGQSRQQGSRDTRAARKRSVSVPVEGDANSPEHQVRRTDRAGRTRMIQPKNTVESGGSPRRRRRQRPVDVIRERTVSAPVRGDVNSPGHQARRAGRAERTDLTYGKRAQAKKP